MGIVNGINVVFLTKKSSVTGSFLKTNLIFPFRLSDHIYLFFLTMNVAVCHTACHYEKVGYSRIQTAIE